MRAYLPDYDVHTPASLDEALSLLAEAPGTWRPLAGGTDLMVLLDSAQLPPGRFLDIRGLTELRGIDVDATRVTLGALTTYSEVLAHPVLAAELPMMAAAARLTAARAIQNRGTIGGNIANASPAADTPPALLAYDAEIELVSARGRRWLPYDGFHTGYKQTRLAPDELIAAVRLPRPSTANGVTFLHAFRKVGTRKAQAISKVCLATLARAEGGRIAEIRVALGAVAPIPLRAHATEAALSGRPLDATTIAAGQAALATELAPIDDIRSNAHYRRQVALNLLGEMLAALSHQPPTARLAHSADRSDSSD